MQTTSSGIWSRVTLSISYVDNTMNTSKCMYIYKYAHVYVSVYKRI